MSSNRFTFTRAYYYIVFQEVFEPEMSFVLSLSDLGIWLAVSSLMMLTAVELTSPFYASRGIYLLTEKRLEELEEVKFLQEFLSPHQEEYYYCSGTTIDYKANKLLPLIVIRRTVRFGHTRKAIADDFFKNSKICRNLSFHLNLKILKQAATPLWLF